MIHEDSLALLLFYRDSESHFRVHKNEPPCDYMRDKPRYQYVYELEGRFVTYSPARERLEPDLDRFNFEPRGPFHVYLDDENRFQISMESKLDAAEFVLRAACVQ